MSGVVLFGTGAVARVVRFLFEHESPHEVVAHAVDRDRWEGGRFGGVPIVPFEDLAGDYPPDEVKLFVAVGYSRMNAFRAERCARARAMGYELVTHVSPRASTWPDLALGDNCLVMDQVIIHPFARVGSDVILWSGSHIGHDSVIGDHCFVSSHAVVSGYATVEERCFLGSNCTIRDGITIARECVIGAGAVVTRSTTPRSVHAAAAAVRLPATSDRLPNL
jgi:sugar O-acyltransferase (sialic acid O-acetyltransferase NeuD family)